jgi:cell division protein FtsQ
VTRGAQSRRTQSRREVAGAAVVNATRRLRARRWAGRRRALRPLLMLAVVIALVAGIGWVALNSSLLEVRQVTVEGTSRLSAQQVLNAAGVRRGESLFRLDPGVIAARVARLPAVASVSVHREWPHGVLIAVVERTPVARVAVGSEAALVDRTGVAFATVPTPPAGLVPLTLGAPLSAAGASDARAAVAIYESLPLPVRRQVAGLRAPSPYDVSFSLRDGRTVVWGSPVGSARKVQVLRALLRRKAHVYDVSTPSVVVTR